MNNDLLVSRVIKLCCFLVSVAYGIKHPLKLALLITLIARLVHVGNLLIVNLEWQNLTMVPRDLNISVKKLLLRGNHITEFNNVSFTVYLGLEHIMAQQNGLRYIREGTFDENAKLKELRLSSNSIIQLPASFGAGGKSIQVLDFRNALQGPAISKLNFTEMGRLKWLSLAKNDCNGTLNAMKFPDSLHWISLIATGLLYLPTFAAENPRLRAIAVNTNMIERIPEDVASIATLEVLRVRTNRLSTLPDLYHLPLIKLHAAHNPLVCNKSLCWIRMWSWMKPPLVIDDITCHLPTELHGHSLMNVRPKQLDCHNGIVAFLTSNYRWYPAERALPTMCKHGG